MHCCCPSHGNVASGWSLVLREGERECQVVSISSWRMVVLVSAMMSIERCSHAKVSLPHVPFLACLRKCVSVPENCMLCQSLFSMLPAVSSRFPGRAPGFQGGKMLDASKNQEACLVCWQQRQRKREARQIKGPALDDVSKVSSASGTMCSSPAPRSRCRSLSLHAGCA